MSEKQVYSNADGRFLPDRYIEGTCPNCGYDRARGDQCENCTKQLDPTDLIDPRSAISGSTDLEVRETKHLFLRQKSMRDQLRDWIKSKKDWPILTTSIALKWLDDGDGCRTGASPAIWTGASRSRTATRTGRAWKARSSMSGSTRRSNISPATAGMGRSAGQGRRGLGTLVADRQGGGGRPRYTQFMGKDNVPFHTLSFPATMILGNFDGAEPWKLVDFIKSFNYLNYEGGQFSTSQRARRLHGPGARRSCPPDYWRWWLL